MCRLIGVVFTNEFPTETLTELRILSEIGSIPGESGRGHRDGWGMASFREGKPYYIGRSTKPAFQDNSYKEAIEAARDLRYPNFLIAHVRAASSGGVSVQNTHPYIVDGLIFAHNGTVNGLPKDRAGRARGETDSELIAILIADRMKETGSLRSAVKSVVNEEIDRRSFTAAVFVASDGRSLVGYRDFSAPERSGYYSLKMAKCQNSISLFQEIAVGCEGERFEIGKRQLVSVTPDLAVASESI